MNNSAIVFVLNDSVRGIKVSYERGEKSYLFKSLDPTIEVDDIVVVPTDTRHNFTCVKVTEVDVDPDLETQLNLKWIVGKVDMPAYEEVLKNEKAAIAAVGKAEKARRRRELRESLFKNEEEQMAGLAIADFTPTPAPSTPDSDTKEPEVDADKAAERPTWNPKPSGYDF